jgi:hypothetical protein
MSTRACAELAVHADHLAIVARRIRIIVAVEIGESSGEMAGELSVGRRNGRAENGQGN